MPGQARVAVDEEEHGGSDRETGNTTTCSGRPLRARRRPRRRLVALLVLVFVLALAGFRHLGGTAQVRA